VVPTDNKTLTDLFTCMECKMLGTILVDSLCDGFGGIMDAITGALARN
jgi:hypothetical protein